MKSNGHFGQDGLCGEVTFTLSVCMGGVKHSHACSALTGPKHRILAVHRCTMSVCPHTSARYSAARRRWQQSGFASEQSRTALSNSARFKVSETFRSPSRSRYWSEYSVHGTSPFWYELRLVSVGASCNSCRYDMPQSSRTKNSRSSRLAKPASCERLRSRVSTSVPASEQTEEFPGCLLCESDREDFHQRLLPRVSTTDIMPLSISRRKPDRRAATAQCSGARSRCIPAPPCTGTRTQHACRPRTSIARSDVSGDC